MQEKKFIKHNYYSCSPILHYDMNEYISSNFPVGA